MSEIQDYNYQKINEKEDYNNDQIKKILIQIRTYLDKLDANKADK